MRTSAIALALVLAACGETPTAAPDADLAANFTDGPENPGPRASAG